MHVSRVRATLSLLAVCIVPSLLVLIVRVWPW